MLFGFFKIDSLGDFLGIMKLSQKGVDIFKSEYMKLIKKHEGEFHEAMNMVSIWKLPIVFLCENNLYGMGAPVKDTFANA